MKLVKHSTIIFSLLVLIWSAHRYLDNSLFNRRLYHQIVEETKSEPKEPVRLYRTHLYKQFNRGFGLQQEF